jgi:general secretion pathway protein G
MKHANAIRLIVVALVVGFAFWWFKIDLDDSHSSKPEIAAVVVKQSLAVPLNSFRQDIGRYPSTGEGLAALSVCAQSIRTSWNGPYLSLDVALLDPWNREYRYRMPGTHNPNSYDLWSLGADGIESSDDIGNW